MTNQHPKKRRLLSSDFSIGVLHNDHSDPWFVSEVLKELSPQVKHNSINSLEINWSLFRHTTPAKKYELFLSKSFSVTKLNAAVIKSNYDAPNWITHPPNQITDASYRRSKDQTTYSCTCPPWNTHLTKKGFSLNVIREHIALPLSCALGCDWCFKTKMQLN